MFASTVCYIIYLTNILHITLCIWAKAEWHGMMPIALARISQKPLIIKTY
jgi:hypothetical protein